MKERTSYPLALWDRRHRGAAFCLEKRCFRNLTQSEVFDLPSILEIWGGTPFEVEIQPIDHGPRSRPRLATCECLIVVGSGMGTEAIFPCLPGTRLCSPQG